MYYFLFFLVNILNIEYIIVLSLVFILFYFTIGFYKINSSNSHALKIVTLASIKSYYYLNFNHINKTSTNINYQVSDLSLYQTNTSGLLHYFIRKNRVFNKGRYSRNRQTCKMAFYLALSIHSIAVTGLFM